MVTTGGDPTQRSTLVELLLFFHENLIACFFALLGAGALSWLVGFNFFLSKQVSA